MSEKSTPMSIEAPRKPPGRPKLPDGVRKTVTLDGATIAAAELIGAGNLSLGLRRAVASASLVDTQAADNQSAPQVV